PAWWGRRLTGRRGGRREMERRSLVLAALGPQAAALDLHELLADGEPEPGPAHLARERRVEPVERLEEPGKVGLADPDAGIDHAHVDEAVLGPHPHARPAGGGELDRVGEQVEQDLLVLGPVTDEAR